MMYACVGERQYLFIVLVRQGWRDMRSGLSLPSFIHIYSNSVTWRDGSVIKQACLRNGIQKGYSLSMYVKQLGFRKEK